MTPALLFLAAVALIGLSALVLRKTTALARVGGVQYERRRRRKAIGLVLLVAAVMCVVVASITLYYSNDNLVDFNAPSFDINTRPPVPTKDLSSLQLATPRSTPPPPAAVPEPPSHPLVIAPPTPATPFAPTSPPLPPMPSLPAIPSLATNNPAPPVSPIVIQSPMSPGALLFSQATELAAHKDFNGALDKVNAAILADPKMAEAYSLRASIYIRGQLWDKAEADYHAALQIDPKNAKMKYNLAELYFLQKKYDAARPDFAELQQDPDVGDLSAYKVFLCDLFGGKEAAAAKELDVFNDVGSNASYYFANLAWCLYHKKVEDARGWQTSAQHIYPSEKFNLYSEALRDIAVADGNAPSTP
jgi:hypothetical protein